MSDNKNNENSADSSVEIESINDGAAGSPSSEGSESDKLKLMQDEVEKYKREYLYLRADFDNYKKGVIKERSDLIKYGSERVFAEIVDVLDNFDRALSFELTPETIETYKEGIRLTASEFIKVLKRFGVSEIDCQGVAFDPSIHEALSSEETDLVPPGHVSRVFKKAYKLHDRVLRPAQVVVAREPQKSE